MCEKDRLRRVNHAGQSRDPPGIHSSLTEFPCLRCGLHCGLRCAVCPVVGRIHDQSSIFHPAKAIFDILYELTALCQRAQMVSPPRLGVLFAAPPSAWAIRYARGVDESGWAGSRYHAPQHPKSLFLGSTYARGGALKPSPSSGCSISRKYGRAHRQWTANREASP